VITHKPINAVGVKVWGNWVGALAQDPESGYYAFEYTPAWISNGQDLSPLFMPKAKTRYIFPDLGLDKFKGLPAMIADCLPDTFGNAVINAYLAEEGIPANEITVLERLAYVGERGMGALTFHPPMMDGQAQPTAVHLADLVLAAKSVVRGQLGSDEANRDAIRQLIQVGTSAGGARPKAVIAYNSDTQLMQSGHMDAPPGYEQWLIKLDGVIAPTSSGGIDLMAPAQYCRTEYAYYLMAKEAGIEMAESALLLEGARAHFMTKRFDRDGQNNRIHLQSLCAMAHLDYGMIGTHSYAQYFQTIEKLGLGKDARAQAFRQMVFNVFAMNRDDHTKNFAFLMPENSTWKLAPAYDLTYAHDSNNQWTMNHLMSVNGKFKDVSLADLRTVGDKFLIEDRENLITQVADAVAQWQEFAQLAGLSNDRTAQIQNDINDHRPL